MGGGSPHTAAAPPPIPVPPPAPVPQAAYPPTLAGSPATIANAGNSASRVKAATGLGFNDTIGTSPQGLTEKVNLAPTTLLGG